MMNTIVIAADHRGLALKEALCAFLTGQEILDLGTHTADSVDYPDFGKAAADAILSDKAEYGILICGTGIGISIAANRYPGIRAAVCHDVLTAQMARQHNNANIIVFGADIITPDVAKDCVRVFLETEFEGDAPDGARHLNRVQKLG